MSRLTRGMVAVSAATVLTMGCSSPNSADVAMQQDRLREIAPSRSGQGFVDEYQMRTLILSVKPESLSAFKFGLEYDGDYKDMVEYTFRDIDRVSTQQALVEHFRRAPVQDGVKVLTDVDDTMYGNLLDKRYPKKTPYPGVLAFYNALKFEPFQPALGAPEADGIGRVPLTTLSARPNPVAGVLEEQSLTSLIDLTRRAFPGSGALQVMPSALSGHLKSSAIGTLQTALRDRVRMRGLFSNRTEQVSLKPGERPVDVLNDIVPHDQEDRIAEVKFANFLAFASVYPEYRFVFVGDSGQADARTARRILESGEVDNGPRVLTTFIHALRSEDGSQAVSSHAFQMLPPERRVTASTTNGRGVIVFRNYIEAASIAYAQRQTLHGLITAHELSNIVETALTQFEADAGRVASGAQPRLRREYREDAEVAVKLLGADQAGAPDRIRRALQRPFWLAAGS